jgi:colanic acid/amylovoran biosynthesis glycosyltransferase
MKIAYLINQYPSVSHSFIRREILALEALGVEVVRFAIRPSQGVMIDPADQHEQTLTRAILAEGVGGLGVAGCKVLLKDPLVWVQALSIVIQMGWKSDRGLLRHIIYLLEACVLLDWLQAEKIEHLHAHFGTNSTTVALLCHMLGGPSYSFTVHGPEEFDKAVLLSLNIKIYYAAFVVAISAYGKSQLYRYCPCSDWHKIQVIHCGVDRHFLEETPPPLADPPHPRLVCVARLDEQKGHLLLLQAVAQLVQTHPDFQLVCVGDGPLRPQLEQQLAELGLKNHVQITGWADTATVRQQILAARALVLPSFAEGLPVVLMEALALQRPVIATYVAGIPELVRPGYNGWLVPAGDVLELAAAMQDVLQASAQDLQRLGEQGRQQIAQQHDVNLEAKRLLHLFEGMVHKEMVR